MPDPAFPTSGPATTPKVSNPAATDQPPVTVQKTTKRVGADFLRTMLGFAGASVLAWLLAPGTLESYISQIDTRWLLLVPIISACLRAAEDYFRHLKESDPFHGMEG